MTRNDLINSIAHQAHLHLGREVRTYAGMEIDREAAMAVQVAARRCGYMDRPLRNWIPRMCFASLFLLSEIYIYKYITKYGDLDLPE